MHLDACLSRPRRSVASTASVMLISTWFVVLGFADTGGGAVGAQSAPVRYRDAVFARVTRSNDLVYGRAVDVPSGREVELHLDIYEPAGDTETARPVLVFVHGGGFVGGDKSAGQRWADEFARRGWVAVSIEYRLNQGDLATVGIPAAVQDARRALRWLRAEAATYRLDVERIVVGGSSAGGITALFVAYTDNEKLPADANVHIAGVMDLWGALYGQESQMTAGEAPLVIVHGTEDTVVPYAYAEALRDRAEAVGVPHAFHPLQGVGHGSGETARISAWTAEFLHPLLWHDAATVPPPLPTSGPTPRRTARPTRVPTHTPPATPETPVPATMVPTITPAHAPEGAPNIVFVLTDDLDLELGALDHAPNIARLLADAGTTLDDFYLTYPLCCPSRSTILRGQYLHNHGVLTNLPPVGGYEKWLALECERSTVGTWLQAAGYRTAYVGKYLNGYPLPRDPLHVPPGWTEWRSPVDNSAYSSYNYRMNENGALVAYGGDPDDHITDVIADAAEASVRRSTVDDRPFFLHVAPYAPHAPADPAPRHASLFPDARVPRVPSFNEADVSDKPARMRLRGLLTAAEITELDAAYRKRLQSMQAVDEMIARLVSALADTGELANTYVVFTSDNGYHMGHHRLPAGKSTAYEEDIHAPLIVRGPGVPSGRTIRGFLAGNVDLAPTFADLAGITPPAFVDGRSLAPLLRADLPEPATWRQAYLVEGYAGGSRSARGTPVATTVDAPYGAVGVWEPPDAFDLAEEPDSARTTQDDPDEGEGREVYLALRSVRYTYVEWIQSGERELYDNDLDPYQLENLAGRVPSTVLDALSARANALHVCAADACRAIEAAALELPAFTPSPARTSATASSTAPPTATPTPDRAWLHLPLLLRVRAIADLPPVRTTAPTVVPTAVPGTIDGCAPDRTDRCRYRPATWIAATDVRALQGFTVTNAAEGRALPIVVRAPAGVAGARPVVVWSHGGGARDEATLLMNREWAVTLARAGYVVVQPAHVSPDRAALCARLGIAVPTDCAALDAMTWMRPSDARAVLDAIPAISSAFPQLARRVDGGRVAYAGHSFGAFTSMTVAGALVDYAPGHTDVSWSHPLPRAFVALSPQGPGRFGFDEDSWREITRPALTVSGAGDTTGTPPLGEQAAERREVFRRMPPGDKYELWLESPDAVHATFNLSDAGAGSRFHDVITMTVVAFLDAHVQDRPSAKAWLASTNVRVLAGDVAEWSRK